ncbi:MAG: tRNA (guanosine(37)-N1)-methyltransferase TrmD [Chitinophagales bacterium]|nr:tRNA (guanosine(37)-N1)-methyltransferase TrmD [Chitinophagales bacterium]MDW8394394.1 tRNA (guanosine(37)-N1)-methyltransferase TrmD [Chitinophagales bacterium]
MRIDIVTLFPELLEGPFSHSILRRAQERGLLEIHRVQLRDFATDRHRTVDDYPYGGGPGMVLMAEPLANCLDHLLSQRKYDEIVYLTPDGERLCQSLCNRLSLHQNLILICGHYKGIDERIRKLYVTREISIGDYVLSGGELAAAVLVDCVARLLPGVLNDEASALFDSFQDNLLAPPVYTRPEVFRGLRVPEVLLSGNQKAIDEWRLEQSQQRTRQRRPDLLPPD